MADLPITSALPGLLSAFETGQRAVLEAPPGAGKTTRVPLALLEAGLVTGRILMLEPRRLAARAAAARMAETLGEEIGQTVGYRIRGETRTSKATRIEVVTEGILTRMIQSDPGLDGIGMVIFDEFHERSLNADLGLALCLEIAEALRDDLKLLVMSATLDAGPVAALMGGAPQIRSEGRSFPVETRWLAKPLPKGVRIAEAAAAQVLEALPETEGGLLVFLPGEGEIRRCAAALSGKLPEGAQGHMLFGALPFKEQQAAIRPAATGRKIVLATSIAETSLTIEDVRVVIDAGRARRARYDPGSGFSRLVTEKVSRAEATQRRGRAGRVAPGTCYRLWTEGEEGALPAYPPAEIEVADLAPFALELALWGAGEDLPLLTPPPEGTLAEAHALLTALGALDSSHRITAHGRALTRLPVHPRLGHMLLTAGKPAAPLAALLPERDILRGAPADLSLRLKALHDPKSQPHEVNRAALAQVRQEAKRLAARTPEAVAQHNPAQMAALAYPDRIALRRKGNDPRYLLSGGKGAVLPEADPLAAARLLVVTDTDGHPREARIRQAVEISEAELRETFASEITWQESCHWSRRERRVIAAREERLGAISLQARAWKDAPPEAIAAAMCDGVRDLGLRPSPAAERLRARVALLRAAGHDLPDMSDDALLGSLEDWLAPYLAGVRTAEHWKGFDSHDALFALLSYEQQQLLARETPAHFETPLGRRIPIDYSGEHPEITLRLQEMFGQTRHPTVAGKPLRVTLLSPAQRPVQTTMDIPAFWDSSYADVRKDMRGRYPKHPWPEDPREADPTLRAKRRG
ncbi:ATP-dependent helicase HrpB [Rhodobacteraceae bacterium 63075]|nr:ATP-dependent helicase HrpB [Rhodobacteraceae bacterium 63075]